MSMGSDLAAGYNIGLRKREMDYRSKPRPMGGHINIGRPRVSPEAIISRAKVEALTRREQELNEQSKELELKGIELDQRIKRETHEDTRLQNERDYWGQRRKEDEARAAYWGEIADKESKEREKALLDEAMTGFYAGDSGAVKQYFDEFGASGISIEGIAPGANGSVTVDFGNGNTETFASPGDAIKKLLLPAETIRQQMKQDPLKLRKEEREQEKYEAEKLGAAGKPEGDLRKEAIDLFMKQNGVMPSEDEIQSYINAIKGPQPESETESGLTPGEEAGINIYNRTLVPKGETFKPIRPGKEVRGKIPREGIRKKLPAGPPEKTGTIRATGDKIAVYADGTVVIYSPDGNIKEIKGNGQA